jgi:hypothetical protein
MNAQKTESSAASDVPKGYSFLYMENFSTDSNPDSNTGK